MEAREGGEIVGADHQKNILCTKATGGARKAEAEGGATRRRLQVSEEGTNRRRKWDSKKVQE